jgi:hypothetical protein
LHRGKPDLAPMLNRQHARLRLALEILRAQTSDAATILAKRKASSND